MAAALLCLSLAPEVAEGRGAERGASPARLIPESFASLEAAVRAATARVKERSVREDREFLGGVFEAIARAGVYRASIGAGRPGRDLVTVRLLVPAGHRLVALWHTHGAPHPAREYFSSRDTALANSLGVPFYLATPSGALRVFGPGDPLLSRLESRRLRLGTHGGHARGSAVAAAESAMRAERA